MRAGKFFMRGQSGSGRFIKLIERINKCYVKYLERNIKCLDDFLQICERYNN